MPPLISVVISVFNKEKYVLNTINSVLNQTYKHYEIIIVNDGSTDNSLEIIKNITNSRITIYSTLNKGAAAARNYGITKASGTFIALLDGDDYWHPFYLEEIIALKNTFPNEFVFATAIALRTKHLTYPAKYSISNLKHQVVNYFKGSQIRTLLSSSSVVIHKSVFKKVLFKLSIVC